MSEKIKNNVLQFPEDNDWFVWKDAKGEVHRFYKGRYAIIRDPNDSYREEYINPDLKWEDAILEFGEIESDVHRQSEIIEKRQINSRKDYEELLKKIKELNKSSSKRK